MTASPSPDTASQNQELIDRFKGEPAPLLPILHAFQDRDGFLSDEAIKAVAAGLRIPIADLYGTVTFYHHLSRVPNGLNAPRVCTGPVCCLQGGNEILEALRKEGATPMPCSGRCDQPVPVIKGHETLVGESAGSLHHEPSPMPPPNPGGHEEWAFAGIREERRATLAGPHRWGLPSPWEGPRRDDPRAGGLDDLTSRPV